MITITPCLADVVLNKSTNIFHNILISSVMALNTAYICEIGNGCLVESKSYSKNGLVFNNKISVVAKFKFIHCFQNMAILDTQ